MRYLVFVLEMKLTIVYVNYRKYKEGGSEQNLEKILNKQVKISKKTTKMRTRL